MPTTNPRTLVAVCERTVADDASRIGPRHADDAGGLRKRVDLSRPRESGSQQPLVTHANRATVQREQMIVQRQYVSRFDPDRLRHLANARRVLR